VRLSQCRIVISAIVLVLMRYLLGRIFFFFLWQVVNGGHGVLVTFGDMGNNCDIIVLL